MHVVVVRMCRQKTGEKRQSLLLLARSQPQHGKAASRNSGCYVASVRCNRDAKRP